MPRKLDIEPRLQGLQPDMIDWARIVSRVVNPVVDAVGDVRAGAASIGTSLDGPAVLATLSANQAISGGIFTAVVFNTIGFETASGSFNVGAGAWSPKLAGYYQINYTIAGVWTQAPTDFRAQLWKNGAAISQGFLDAPVSVGGFAVRSASDLVYLNGSTDYVQIVAWMNAASGTFNVVGGVANSRISGHLARRA